MADGNSNRPDRDYTADVDGAHVAKHGPEAHIVYDVWPWLERRRGTGRTGRSGRGGGRRGRRDEGREGGRVDELGTGPSFPVSFTEQNASDRLEAIAARMAGLWGDDGIDELGDVDQDWGDFARARPSEAEYACLDEWLDDDQAEVSHPLATVVTHPSGDGSTTERPASSHTRFEDDFADYTLPRAQGRAGLDPTPLLLHLQSLRAELAGVEDEDERRVRAGREVEHLMQSLGL